MGKAVAQINQVKKESQSGVFVPRNQRDQQICRPKEQSIKKYIKSNIE